MWNGVSCKNPLLFYLVNVVLSAPAHRCFREPQVGFVQHCRLCAGLSSLFPCWNPMGGGVSASFGSTQSFLFVSVFGTQLHPSKSGELCKKILGKCFLLGTFPQSQAAKALEWSREWSSSQELQLDRNIGGCWGMEYCAKIILADLTPRR